MPRFIPAFGLISILALAPSLVSAHEHEEALESVVIAMADQPAAHAALAEHYRAKAAEARATSARHRSLGRVYRGGKQGTGAGRLHCRRISTREAAIAAQYEELAKLHDAEAGRHE